MLQIVRVIDEFPEGFGALLAEAQAEGVRNMTLLAEQWTSGEQRFDADGAALFAAFVSGELAGVGGVSAESAHPAMRMRRLYVRPIHRRSGVGRALAGVPVRRESSPDATVTVSGAGGSPTSRCAVHVARCR